MCSLLLACIIDGVPSLHATSYPCRLMCKVNVETQFECGMSCGARKRGARALPLNHKHSVLLHKDCVIAGWGATEERLLMSCRSRNGKDGCTHFVAPHLKHSVLLAKFEVPQALQSQSPATRTILTPLLLTSPTDMHMCLSQWSCHAITSPSKRVNSIMPMLWPHCQLCIQSGAK